MVHDEGGKWEFDVVKRAGRGAAYPFVIAADFDQKERKHGRARRSAFSLKVTSDKLNVSTK